MQFNEIRKELESVIFDTLRADSDNYFEAVIVKDELVKLTEILERFFGSTAWPSQNKLSSQIEDAISSFGGIAAGQALYFWNQGSDTVFAMLWPWQDKRHVTVKIIQEQR